MFWKVASLIMLTAVTLAAQVPPAAAHTVDSAAVASKADTFVIETHHRIFTDFVQTDSVTLGEPFFLGEEEYRAEVIAFNPHLGITQKGEVLTMSDTLYNPAARIRVTLDGKEVQQSWAFANIGAPHFYREDVFGFKLLDFSVGDKYIPVPTSKPEQDSL